MTKTRELAYNILKEIDKGGYSHLLLKKMLPQELSGQDRGFVSALVYGVAERQITLDDRIGRFINPRKTAKDVLILLRLGAYQILYMDVPDHAAVNETVNLAKKLRFNSAFVNGVMRNLLRTEFTFPEEDDIHDLDALSVKYSMPKALLQKWKDDYGLKITYELAKYVQQPYTGLRAVEGKNSAEELSAALSKLGAKCEQGIFEDSLRVTGLSRTDNEYYRKGCFTVQGEGAMLGARAALPCGERILDMCAAPGGKSIYLAQLKEDACITAWDVHPHRVDLIRANAKRMGLKERIHPQVQDATCYEPRHKESFDCVIVDAPCSSLGTIWQKPEIRYRVDEKMVKSLNGVQKQLLHNAAQYVVKGGVVVYCTCTLSADENDRMVKAFIETHPHFVRERIEGLPDCLDEIQRQGAITLFPYRFGTEGFYVARLRRTE